MIENATILIIDDQPVNIALLEDILHEAGYRNIRSTTDPYSAVPLYHEVRPDLILLDLAMPGLDGLAVLERLRPFFPAQAYMPVLVLTADSTGEAKERALRGGAKDFLVKPFSVSEVLLRIGNLIETRKLHQSQEEHAHLLEQKVRERTRELEEQVAERKQAEVALRESEARYRQLIEATFDLVSTIGKDGRFLFVNRAWVETLGYTAEEARDLCLWDIIAERAQAGVREQFNALVERGEQQELQSSMVVKGGRLVAVEGNLVAAQARDGSRCIYSFLRDVTQRTHAERAQREKELAEAGSSAKSQMLANMSHELRTPLNSIIGFGRVLQTGSYGALNERQESYVRHIVRAGEHMLGLVNALLDLQRIEEDRLSLEIRSISIRTVVEDAKIMVASLINERQHRLVVHIDDDTPAVLADYETTVAIVVNLLSNAAKYTENGGLIEVRARRGGEAAAHVEIVDNGRGIAEENLERVFDYFVQVDAKHTRSNKGYGIGLTLTRKLVDAMGGEIGLRSALGVGSTFWFTLPAVQIRRTDGEAGR